ESVIGGKRTGGDQFVGDGVIDAGNLLERFDIGLIDLNRHINVGFPCGDLSITNILADFLPELQDTDVGAIFHVFAHHAVVHVGNGQEIIASGGVEVKTGETGRDFGGGFGSRILRTNHKHRAGRENGDGENNKQANSTKHSVPILKI